MLLPCGAVDIFGNISKVQAWSAIPKVICNTFSVDLREYCREILKAVDLEVKTWSSYFLNIFLTNEARLLTFFSPARYQGWHFVRRWSLKAERRQQPLRLRRAVPAVGCIAMYTQLWHTLTTWWLIPLSKWVITPVINGISRVNPLRTRVITHLLSGMSH